jgi:hypothetical protein
VLVGCVDESFWLHGIEDGIDDRLVHPVKSHPPGRRADARR